MSEFWDVLLRDVDENVMVDAEKLRDQIVNIIGSDSVELAKDIAAQFAFFKKLRASGREPRDPNHPTKIGPMSKVQSRLKTLAKASRAMSEAVESLGPIELTSISMNSPDLRSKLGLAETPFEQQGTALEHAKEKLLDYLGMIRLGCTIFQTNFDKLTPTTHTSRSADYVLVILTQWKKHSPSGQRPGIWENSDHDSASAFVRVVNLCIQHISEPTLSPKSLRKIVNAKQRKRS